MTDADWWGPESVAGDAELAVWADYLEETGDPRMPWVRELRDALRQMERDGGARRIRLRWLLCGAWYWRGTGARRRMSRGRHWCVQAAIILAYDDFPLMHPLLCAIGRRLGSPHCTFGRLAGEPMHLDFDYPPY